MFPLEPLFCPCCTPAILHALAQSDLTRIPQQIFWLGTGAMSAVIKRYQQQPRSAIASIDPIADDALVPVRESKVSIRMESSVRLP